MTIKTQNINEAKDLAAQLVSGIEGADLDIVDAVRYALVADGLDPDAGLVIVALAYALAARR